MKIILPIIIFSTIGMLVFASVSINNPDKLPDPPNVKFPNVDSTYLVKIVQPGVYNKSYFNFDANIMEWFVLSKSTETFYIRKMQIDMTEVKGESENKFKLTCTDSLNARYFISGVDMIDKDVIEMSLGRRELGFGDRLEISYGKKKMIFSAEGEEVKDRRAKQDYIGNYKLYVAEGKKEKNKTVLVHLNRLGKNLPFIKFMGDVDNDKIPDIFLEIKEDNGMIYDVLYLSNNPKKGTCYKVVSVFKYK